MSSGGAHDALVIGAGMSGLAAGIRLAQFDLDVCVLEKHSLWGGLNSFYKKGGRRFDVGLHAMTNYVPKGTRGKPLARLLRQLRLSHDDLRLCEQGFSEVAFPTARLTFSNDRQRFESEVARVFPHQIDAYRELVADVEAFDAFDTTFDDPGARAVLARYFSEPLLVEMLLLPTCYYGSARENDIDWYQFVIIFQAVFLEGFARPEGGIRTMLDLLLERYESLGGELRMRSGVERILVEGGRARGVVLDSGETLRAEHVLSSAGYLETLALLGEDAPPAEPESEGRISFIETISVLDREPKDIGYEATVTFFNDADELCYRVPAEDRIEPRCGVLCSPNNYANPEPLREGMMRATVVASYDRWKELDEAAYVAAKEEDFQRAQDAVCRFAPDPRPYTTYTDMFTPLTIERFTGHRNGAVYGARKKRRDGTLGIEGLSLVGTDQGMLGIVGSMLSGISIANANVLMQRA